MQAWLRRVIKIEDALWAAWLVVLRPASGELLLEGGLVTAFLVLAAGLYWLSGLMAEAGGGRRSGMLLMMTLGLCAIVTQAGLEQLGAPQWVIVWHTIVVLVLVALLVIQHLTTRGRSWWTLPRWLRRALTWPMVMAMAETFGQMLTGFIGLAKADDGLGFLVVVFGAFMPTLYAVFVVALRMAADPSEPTSWRVWAGRYLWALACAAMGAYVVEPLPGWLGLTDA